MASNASEPRRPLVGLTTYLETASWGAWSRPAVLVPCVYLDAVTRADAQPVLLPPVPSDVAVLEVLDGLVVIGGADVDPATYGAAPHPATEGTRPERDLHESRLLRGALERRLPVLAICRGAQMLAAVLGGRLHQHLPEVVGHEGHRPERGVFGTSRVTTEPGSLVARTLGPATTVPCHHHQGLAEVVDPLRATAWAEDGLVEAVEMEGAWVLGVQWHPEENPDDLRVFDAHARAARQRTESLL